MHQGFVVFQVFYSWSYLPWQMFAELRLGRAVLKAVREQLPSKQASVPGRNFWGRTMPQFISVPLISIIWGLVSKIQLISWYEPRKCLWTSFLMWPFTRRFCFFLHVVTVFCRFCLKNDRGRRPKDNSLLTGLYFKCPRRITRSFIF